MPKVLKREFYNRDTVLVARELLGKVLRHGETSGIIVETEAYLGADDLAAHSAAGITPRTRVIFGPPGHAYVYLSYGMHECLNIVAEPDGMAGCVLIRALQPLDGMETMRMRRPKAKSDRELANGPGKLTRALAITRELNGADVVDSELRIERGDLERFEVAVSSRIGISKCVDWPLRFYIAGNRFVSGARPKDRSG